LTVWDVVIGVWSVERDMWEFRHGGCCVWFVAI